MIELKLNIPEYNSKRGLQSIWEDGFSLETNVIENQILLKANKKGLISLAKQLLQLAQDETPIGCHYHFDEYNGLESGSIELIISKI